MLVFFYPVGCPLVTRLNFGSGKRDAQKGAAGCNSAGSLFERIPALLDELREYANHYVAAQKDMTRAKAKQTASKALLLGLVAMVVLGVVFGSVLLLLAGMALGLGELIGDRFWLGFLVTGLVLLSLIGLGTWFGVRRWQASSRESTIKQYEQRHKLQKIRYHRSVDQPCTDTNDQTAARPEPSPEQREPIR